MRYSWWYWHHKKRVFLQDTSTWLSSNGVKIRLVWSQDMVRIRLPRIDKDCPSEESWVSSEPLRKISSPSDSFSYSYYLSRSSRDSSQHSSPKYWNQKIPYRLNHLLPAIQVSFSIRGQPRESYLEWPHCLSHTRIFRFLSRLEWSTTERVAVTNLCGGSLSIFLIPDSHRVADGEQKEVRLHAATDRVQMDVQLRVLSIWLSFESWVS